MKKALRFFLFISFAVILVSLDQWTKHLAIQYLKGGREIHLIPHVLSLLYVENPGAAFGILHGQQGFFLLITIAVYWGVSMFSIDFRRILRLEARMLRDRF